jgi:hypothetical protein
VTDIASYATLGTDDIPRFLARTSGNDIYLDDGTLVTALPGSLEWASLLPFRPGASPQSWIYITNGENYIKVSAPPSPLVVQRAGIEEPSHDVDAVAMAPTYTTFNALVADWVVTGPANTPTDLIPLDFTDSISVVFADPLVPSRQSLGVGNSNYVWGMLMTYGGTAYPVSEFWPAIDTCNILAIRYYSGVSGKCQIVPSLNLSETIGRGAILQIGSEYVLVLNVLAGENGSCAFECSTSGTHTVGEAITGQDALVTYSATPFVIGSGNLTMPLDAYFVDGGSGPQVATFTYTFTPPFNPFPAYAADDYIHCTLIPASLSGYPVDITAFTIIFNLGTTQILTYPVPGLTPAVPTAPGIGGTLIQVDFPISALNGDLSGCTGVTIQVNYVLASQHFTLAFGSFWVGGGGLPDIGSSGAPYQYQVVPRSTTTGAMGNASPLSRAAVVARRQKIYVGTSTLSFTDPQVTLLDIYRYGGSLTAAYYDSTTPPSTDFIDNYFDDSVEAGAPLPLENYEPWPSIDLPFSQTGGIAVQGTWVTLTGMTSISPYIDRWLPGTLISLGGIGTFTLRSRPTRLSAISYLFELVECAGAGTAYSFSIQEPEVAAQRAWRIWGPDKYGTVFGVGDSLRPGVVYWAEPFTPSVVSDQASLELCAPSEPLMGGELLNDLPFVASSNRWWALYPSFSLPAVEANVSASTSSTQSSYVQIEVPVGRGLLAPMASCTDGKWIYFWAKDGIYRHQGGVGESLTDKDLYNLFPHEGVSPVSTILTVPYPDYSRAQSFRLAVVNNYLFVDFLTHGGYPATLVCDLRTGGWSYDSYHDPVICHYQPAQASASLSTAPALHTLMVMGDANGGVWVEQDAHNDNLTPISCIVSTSQWDGGDGRSQPEWGDMYLDCLPAARGGSPHSGVTVLPMSISSAITPAATYIPTSVLRMFAPCSLGGDFFAKALGMQVEWIDDFTLQSEPTVLYQWQASEIPQPEITTDRFGDWDGSLVQ